MLHSNSLPVHNYNSLDTRKHTPPSSLYLPCLLRMIASLGGMSRPTSYVRERMREGATRTKGRYDFQFEPIGTTHVSCYNRETTLPSANGDASRACQ